MFQLNFSLRWRQFGNSTALPSGSSALAKPGKCLSGDRSRWRMPGGPGHATRGVYHQRLHFYICLFPLIGGHELFPDDIWKVRIWWFQIVVKNRSVGLGCSCWSSKGRWRGWTRSRVTCLLSGIGKSLKLLLFNMCLHQMALSSLYSFWTSGVDPTNTPKFKSDSVLVFLKKTHARGNETRLSLPPGERGWTELEHVPGSQAFAFLPETPVPVLARLTSTVWASPPAPSFLSGPEEWRGRENLTEASPNLPHLWFFKVPNLGFLFMALCLEGSQKVPRPRWQPHHSFFSQMLILPFMFANPLLQGQVVEGLLMVLGVDRAISGDFLELPLSNDCSHHHQQLLRSGEACQA